MTLDHETRRTGIGGSDIGALLRVSKYRTPMDVYLSKTLPTGDRAPDTGPQEWGHRLESAVLDKLCEVYGVTMTPAPGTVRSTDWYHAVATPDGIGEGFILEAKTRRYEDGWGASGSTVIPEDVFAQVQWYMGILHRPVCYVGVLIGGSDFRHYAIPYDGPYFVRALHVAQAFWSDYIKAGVAPPVDGGEGSARWLSVTFPSVEDSTLVDADEYQVGLIRSILEARREVERATALRDRLEQLARQEIGSRRGLTSSIGTITWSDIRGRTKVDWEKVAQAAGATPDLISQYTVTGDPSRRFMVKTPKEAMV